MLEPRAPGIRGQMTAEELRLTRVQFLTARMVADSEKAGAGMVALGVPPAELVDVLIRANASALASVMRAMLPADARQDVFGVVCAEIRVALMAPETSGKGSAR